jgi:hypothetical protein
MFNGDTNALFDVFSAQGNPPSAFLDESKDNQPIDEMDGVVLERESNKRPRDDQEMPTVAAKRVISEKTANETLNSHQEIMKRKLKDAPAAIITDAFEQESERAVAAGGLQTDGEETLRLRHQVSIRLYCCNG